MRISIPILAAALVVAAAAGDQPRDKDGVIREMRIDAPLAVPSTFGIKIASADEAARILPAEEHLKQFNFGQEYLLLFSWQGSGTDKLSYQIEKGNDPAVVFSLVRGFTKDKRKHIRLYAIAKNVPGDSRSRSFLIFRLRELPRSRIEVRSRLRHGRMPQGRK
jgi:hypothetical protein